MKRKSIYKPLFEFALLTLIIFLVLLLFSSGCKHEPVLPALPTKTTSNSTPGSDPTDTGTTYTENTCDPDSVYFANDILPLFISNCAKSGCHDAASHQEGIILNSYTNIMTTGNIRPGDPSHGKIVEAITTTEADDIMPRPPAPPLSSSQINSIIKWINQGAQNNSCSGHCDTTWVTYSLTVAPLLQTKCVGCHNNSLQSGYVNLAGYNGVYAVATNGKLMHTINHDAGFSPMPKGGTKMPACEIDEIRIWVNGGAPNN